jgi:hypothetical protein
MDALDPLHFCIAMGPVAVYCLLLGLINFRRRPFVTSGTRDALALGIAISGFAIAGPMELFLPTQAAHRFGPLVWVLMIAFYGLCLTLIVLLMRPRLVIYNSTVDQLRPILAGVVAELDKDSRWAGDSLSLPSLGIQLHIESFSMMRNTQLVASNRQQSYNGWRQLEISLTGALRDTQSGPNPYAIVLLSVSVLLTVAMAAWGMVQHEELARALRDMFQP